MRDGSSTAEHTPEHRVLWRVVEDHLEEASFALQRTLAGQKSFQYTLRELALGPERRLLANLAGVELAGEAAFTRLLAPLFASPDDAEPGALGVACLVAIGCGRFDVLTRLLMEGPDPAFEVLCQAVALEAGQGTERWIRELADQTHTESGEVRARLLRLAATSGLGVEPLWGSLQAAHQGECEAAAALLRWLPSERYASIARHVAASGSPQAQLSVAHALLQWRAVDGLALCEDLLGEPQVADSALSLLGLFGGPKHHQLLLERLENGASRPAVLRALGQSGNVDVVEHALPWLACDDARTVRLAGEAIALITGFDAWDERHQVPAPPTKPPAEDDVLTPSDPDEALPCLDPEAVAAFWHARRHALTGKGRLLQGEADLEQALVTGLRHGRRRHADEFDLALTVRSGGACSVRTRRFAYAQRERLAAMPVPSMRLSGLVMGW